MQTISKIAKLIVQAHRQKTLDDLKDTVDKLYALGAVQEARELNAIITAGSGPSQIVVSANHRLAFRLLHQAETQARNTNLKSRLALLRYSIEQAMWNG